MSDKTHHCQRCANCPFGHMRPSGHLDLGGQGDIAVACAMVAVTFKDLSCSRAEARQEAWDWLNSKAGQWLLTMLDVPYVAAMKQAALLFRCGQIRGGLLQGEIDA